MHQAVHNTLGLAKTEFSYCLTAGEKLGAEVSLDYLTNALIKRGFSVLCFNQPEPKRRMISCIIGVAAS
jgi:hypothetical protein